jgi:hypothetical protein
VPPPHRVVLKTSTLQWKEATWLLGSFLTSDDGCGQGEYGITVLALSRVSLPWSWRGEVWLVKERCCHSRLSIAIRQPTSHVSTYNLCFDMYVRIMGFQGRSKRLSSRLPQGFDSPVKLYTTWSGPMNTRHLQLGALGGTLSWTTEVCTGKSDNALTPGRKGFFEL